VVLLLGNRGRVLQCARLTQCCTAVVSASGPLRRRRLLQRYIMTALFLHDPMSHERDTAMAQSGRVTPCVKGAAGRTPCPAARQRAGAGPRARIVLLVKGWLTLP